jgi:hypothetical protein
MVYFITLVQQILGKVMGLKCDDGSYHLRKETFNVDAFSVKWGTLTPMEKGTLNFRIGWYGNIKYRLIDPHVRGSKLVGAT